MDNRIVHLIENLKRRNIQGFYCENKSKAQDKVTEFIPLGASVGISGSLTLDQLGIVNFLGRRGNKVFNQYESGISREESLALRRQGASADYYLSSANAVSEKGELVFFSGFGNRTAGIAYAKNVIVVCGVNKITVNLEEAMKRAREYVTPLNCRRLNWNSACLKDGICRKEVCLFPEYKRMCCQLFIIEAEVEPARLKVLLVGETLGY